MKMIGLEETLLLLESGSRPKGGASQSGEGVFSLGAEHLDSEGSFNLSNPKLIPHQYYSSMRSGIVSPNSILIVKDGATTGKVSFIGESFLLTEAAINEHLFLLKVDEKKAFPKYVFYHLFSPIGQSQILKDFRGATVGGITRSFVQKVSFRLPSLEEQHRIAAILDKADAVRRKRLEAIRLTEELLRSVFLDMFGDPVTNPKGWDVVKFGDILTEIESGWSPICDSRQAEAEEWGVLKLGSVTYGHFDPTENKAMLQEDSPCLNLEVKPGDLLLTRKNTYELVGASAFVYKTRPKLMLPDLIFRLCLINEVDPVYIWQTLSQRTMRHKLSRLAGGTAGSMPNISKTRLRTLLVTIPPLELQSKYREIVGKFWDKQQHQKSSLEVTNNLFNSLLQRAFRGEL